MHKCFGQIPKTEMKQEKYFSFGLTAVQIICKFLPNNQDMPYAISNNLQHAHVLSMVIEDQVSISESFLNSKDKEALTRITCGN